MAIQSALGLLHPEWYRDAGWIKTTWFGNDWVTLVVAVPLMLYGATHRGSPSRMLLWLGTLGYAIYNYAFYLFGAALNVFFPIYIACLMASNVALALGLKQLDVTAMPAAFGVRLPARVIGGYLTVVGISLSGVWLAIWAAHIFAGRPTPVDPEVFRLVAALDCVLMSPALVIGGIGLLRRRAWGYVLASIAAVQSSLYLLVLSVNAAIFNLRGLAESPGELPLWGTLAVITSTAASLLLADTRWIEDVP